MTGSRSRVGRPPTITVGDKLAHWTVINILRNPRRYVVVCECSNEHQIYASSASAGLYPQCAVCKRKDEGRALVLQRRRLQRLALKPAEVVHLARDGCEYCGRRAANITPDRHAVCTACERVRTALDHETLLDFIEDIRSLNP